MGSPVAESVPKSRRLCAPLLACVLTGTLAVACVPLPPPDSAPEYRNPVLDRDFPDPAVLRAPDGWLYAYATQTWDGTRMLNIQVARSRDLVQWEYLGNALPHKPSWASGKSNQEFWAPHVVYDAIRRKYFMYYSAEHDGSTGKCLAVATADAPQGPFADVGAPLVCGEGFENIDPMAFDDPQSGKRLLYWGSGFEPIRVQELAPDRLGFMPGSSPTAVVFPDAGKPFRRLVEGAWLTYRQGRYYLFYSGDACCGWKARYAVLVARAENPFGPFEDYVAADRVDNVMLRSNGVWRAPGHNSVIRDDAGDDWLLYHAIHDEHMRLAERTQAPFTPRVMLLDRLEYRDGWPRVRGDEPSVAPRAGPVWRSP
jgi:arabinan endo-1,5-alpha-L-arabinosidase